MPDTQRRFVITGAASGIGRSVAELAADTGAAVSLVDIDVTGLEVIAASLRERGVRVTTIVADLSRAEEPSRVVAESAEFLGGIDVLVSNAGAPVYARLTDLTVDGFDQAVALNVRATWLLGQAAHPWLSESGGNIVVTGSTCGHWPAPPQGAYSVAKAGLLMLVKQMALEWSPDGIRCNSASPGPTMTGLTEGVFNDLRDPKQRAVREMREARLPTRKLGTADDVAHTIMFLASPEASQITGIDILVDGGTSVTTLASAGIEAGH